MRTLQQRDGESVTARHFEVCELSLKSKGQANRKSMTRLKATSRRSKFEENSS